MILFMNHQDISWLQGQCAHESEVAAVTIAEEGDQGEASQRGTGELGNNPPWRYFATPSSSHKLSPIKESCLKAESPHAVDYKREHLFLCS